MTSLEWETKVNTLEAEVARLKGIISRNKAAFEKTKEQAEQHRDRAMRAESALHALARGAFGGVETLQA